MRTAWRNLWRNRRRTIITLVAVVLNTVVLILLVGWVNGILAQMVRNTTQMHSGEAQVHAPNYLRNRALDAVIEDPQAILAAAAKLGLAAAPRQFGFGMAAVDDKERPDRGAKSSGAMLWGVEPRAEREAFTLPGYVGAGGRFLRDEPARAGEPALPEAVIGGRLARSLHAAVGDELIVFGGAADGSTFDALFRIVGIFDLVGEPVDRMAVWIHEREFRQLYYPRTERAWYMNDAPADVPAAGPEPEALDPFDLFEEGADTEGRRDSDHDGFDLFEDFERGDGTTDADDVTAAADAPAYQPPWVVHEIALNSRGAMTSTQIVEKIWPVTGRDVPQPWQELNPSLAEMINASSASLAFLYGIFFVVAALSVMNTMLMATFERMREFGVLKAVGTEPRRLVVMVAIEAATLGAVAVGIGAALGALLTVWLGQVGLDLSGLLPAGTTIAGVAVDPVWRPVFTPSGLLIPTIGMWLTCVLASLYPASLAARVNVVRILQAN